MGAAYRNCRYIAKSLPIVKAKRATMSTNTGAKVKPEKSCRIAYNYETHFFGDSGVQRYYYYQSFVSHKNWICNVKVAR